MELAKINPITQVARIAHTVGKKKRTQIVAEAKKLNLKVVNAKEVKAPAKEEAETKEAKETEDKTKKERPVKTEKKKNKKPKKTEEKTEKEDEKQ